MSNFILFTLWSLFSYAMGYCRAKYKQKQTYSKSDLLSFAQSVTNHEVTEHDFLEWKKQSERKEAESMRARK